MDVLEHLEHEHREVERMLDELEDTEPGDDRAQLILDLEEALRLHMAVEEQHLYPIVADVMDEEHAVEAQVEHDLARDGLAKLKELAEEPGFGAAVDMLRAGIAHHVREEEDEIFPELRDRAGERIATMDPERLEEESEPVAAIDDHEPPDTEWARGRVPAGATRDELYERAKDADIPGRSSMTKDELARALQG